jgi:uncharacterized protein YaiL (DUF2058 family)
VGDLRDAFKKAGLIGDQDERRLAHEERVARKELGRSGLEQQKQKEDDERRRRDEQKRAETKAAQEKHDAARQRDERWRKLVRELEAQGLRGGSGPRRFHYREPDGHLPCLLVDDECGRRLEAGELAIVALPAADAAHGPVLIVPRSLAVELRSIEPQLVLHMAGRA